MAEFEQHESCPKCPSSDALARYADGTGYCFSCNTYIRDDGTAGTPNEAGKSLPSLIDGEVLAINSRMLQTATCRKYGYKMGLSNGQRVQLATYTDAGGRPVAQKVRTKDKKFRWTGDPKRALLFGQQLWSEGGRRVVVTEGEIDALSVAQALGLRWPVVSVPNGAPGARKDLAKHLEFLESFDEVILMFDNDDPGRAAAVACAELFAPGKARIATLPLKDPNEMVVAGLSKQLVDATWQAKPYRPDGIVSGADLWSLISTELPHGKPYPWPSLDKYLYGMRTSEIVCWTGGTGIGKSLFVKEVAHHLALTHGAKVGIISLEESVRHAALCQVSLTANRPLHLPPVRERMTEEAMKACFKASLGSGNYFFYDHFGSMAADGMLPKIRYMAKCLGVKWVVLDHISIMVSGMATEGDERKRIDELMTHLRSLAEELDIGIHIVSHLRKANGTPHEEGGRVSLVDLRGSGAIAQMSDIVVGAERNQQHDDPLMRNVTTLRVVKNRFSGETGIACTVQYDTATGRLDEIDTVVAKHALGPIDEASPFGEL